MRTFVLAAGLICLFGPAPASAEAAQTGPVAVTASPSADHSDLARRFVTVAGGEEVFINAGIAGIEAALIAQGQRLSTAQRDRLHASLRDVFRASAQVYVAEMTTFYTTHARADDLQAALTYYESELGQEYVVVAVDFVLGLLRYALSEGRTPLPSVPENLDRRHEALAARMGAAFFARLTPLEREQLSAINLEGATFTDLMGRHIAGRLDVPALEAAIAWSETEASRRLETGTPERAAAEQLATLRAMRALDVPAIASVLQDILSETPTYQ